MRITRILSAGIGLMLTASLLSGAAPTLSPGPVPPEVREQFKLAPFYQKYVAVGGLPIVGSPKVSDEALAECAWIVTHMLEARPEVLKALADGRIHFAIMAHDEYTTDLPEHADLKPRVYWDRRARGLGATPESPVVSGGEENLLAYPGDPYPNEVIPIHEFGHAIHEVAMKALDPTFDKRLLAAYDAAIQAGLWKNTYAAVNHKEYWAEGVQDWFDNNDANNALHNDINTRAKLKTHDPALAALCREVFGDLAWRYQKPALRQPGDRAHLQGLDPAKAPRFQWRREAVPEKPKVSLDCAAGNVELEFSGTKEDLTRLLGQVQEGFYSGGRAVFGDKSIRLSPAPRTSAGDVIPDGTGGWEFQLGQDSPGVLSVRIAKGEEVLASLRKDAAGKETRVQRMVRLD